MGLLAVWYGDFFGAQSVGVMPYDQYLKRFPAYLQQLTMESNGKHVTLEGEPVDYETGAVYWGEPGTNGQHSFYQLIHQGTKLIPVDLIGFAEEPQPPRRPSRHLDLERLRPGPGARLRQDRGRGAGRGHARARRPPPCDGGQPADQRAACRTCSRRTRSGALVALYEHSVFTQGAIWGIDSFDQWGVELGKALASEIIPELTSTDEPGLAHDSSTNALIRRYRSLKH